MNPSLPSNTRSTRPPLTSWSTCRRWHWLWRLHSCVYFIQLSHLIWWMHLMMCLLPVTIYSLYALPSTLYSSSIGSTSSPSALKCLLGSQTCKTLSSAVLAKCHFAAGLQLISLGFEVCPPWTNINSGGPSSASSGVCSAPIWSRFQIWIRRSSEADAKWVPRWGDHATCVTGAEWDSNEWSLVEILRISHSATVWNVSYDHVVRRRGPTLSPDPVRRSHSLSGANETALISDLWALSPWAGLGPVLRVSHLAISHVRGK